MDIYIYIDIHGIAYTTLQKRFHRANCRVAVQEGQQLVTVA